MSIFRASFSGEMGWLRRLLVRLYVPLSPYLYPFAGLNRTYRRLKEEEQQVEAAGLYGGKVNFFDRVLMQLDISYSVVEGEVEQIPQEGPLLVVANHPTGGIDGVILASLIKQVRDDIRIMVMAGTGLEALPELDGVVIPVDLSVFEGTSTANQGPLKESLRWLRSGKTLVIFPSGGLPIRNPETKDIEERPWKEQVAKIAKLSRATVLPVYIEGRTSKTYQFMGNVHDSFRIFLLPQQIMRLKGRILPVVIGQRREALESDDLKGWIEDLQDSTMKLSEKVPPLHSKKKRRKLKS